MIQRPAQLHRAQQRFPLRRTQQRTTNELQGKTKFTTNDDVPNTWETIQYTWIIALLMESTKALANFGSWFFPCQYYFSLQYTILLRLCLNGGRILHTDLWHLTCPFLRHLKYFFRTKKPHMPYWDRAFATRHVFWGLFACWQHFQMHRHAILVDPNGSSPWWLAPTEVRRVLWRGQSRLYIFVRWSVSVDTAIYLTWYIDTSSPPYKFDIWRQTVTRKKCTAIPICVIKWSIKLYNL